MKKVMSMFVKRLEAEADLLGLDWTWEESSLSSSKYFTAVSEDGRSLTVRFSDHVLPPSYIERDNREGREVFEVGTHPDANGDAAAALAYLRWWFSADGMAAQAKAEAEELERRREEFRALCEARRPEALEARALDVLSRELRSRQGSWADRFARVHAGDEFVCADCWKRLKRSLLAGLRPDARDDVSQFVRYPYKGAAGDCRDPRHGEPLKRLKRGRL